MKRGWKGLIISLLVVLFGMIPARAETGNSKDNVYIMGFRLNKKFFEHSLPEEVRSQWVDAIYAQMTEEEKAIRPDKNKEAFYYDGCVGGDKWYNKDIPDFQPVTLEEMDGGKKVTAVYEVATWVEINTEDLNDRELAGKLDKEMSEGASLTIYNIYWKREATPEEKIDNPSQNNNIVPPSVVTPILPDNIVPPSVVTPILTDKMEPPTVDIDMEETPLGKAAEEEEVAILEEPEEELVTVENVDKDEIASDEIPLTDIPKTNDLQLSIGIRAGMMSAIGFLGIALIALTLKNKRNR